MRHFRTIFFLLALTSACSVAMAADGGNKTIIDAIHKLAPKAKVEMITPAPLAGFHSAVIDGTVVYVRDDGKYLIHGQVFDLTQPHVTDVSAAAMDKVRRQALAKVPAAEHIRFAPKDPKYTITAFVDVDCPFCRQFHARIAQYNAQGIAVDYLLFPLDGLHPQASRKAQAVWCSADRKAAYSAAMSGKDPGDLKCTNPIKKVQALGRQMGVDGTPTIIAADGSLISPRVAQSPSQLAAVLKARSAKPTATGG